MCKCKDKQTIRPEVRPTCGGVYKFSAIKELQKIIEKYLSSTVNTLTNNLNERTATLEKDIDDRVTVLENNLDEKVKEIIINNLDEILQDVTLLQHFNEVQNGMFTIKGPLDEEKDSDVDVQFNDDGIVVYMKYGEEKQQVLFIERTQLGHLTIDPITDKETKVFIQWSQIADLISLLEKQKLTIVNNLNDLLKDPLYSNFLTLGTFTEYTVVLKANGKMETYKLLIERNNSEFVYILKSKNGWAEVEEVENELGVVSNVWKWHYYIVQNQSDVFLEDINCNNYYDADENLLLDSKIDTSNGHKNVTTLHYAKGYDDINGTKAIVLTTDNYRNGTKIDIYTVHGQNMPEAITFHSGNEKVSFGFHDIQKLKKIIRQ